MAKTKKSEAIKSNAGRDLYLDALKGFAILLVVLGHSLQTYVPNGAYDNNIFFRLIYSFHMPLFMFLSGAAATYSLRPMGVKFIQKKFLLLAVPFIAWYMLGYLLNDTYKGVEFHDYIHRLIQSPDYGLWFLWVLFLNFCVLALAKNLHKLFSEYSYFITWLVIYSIPTSSYGIGLLKWHFPFFAAGYLIYLHKHKLSKFRKPALYTCISVAPFLMATWHRLYYPSFVNGLEPRLIVHGLQTIYLGDIGNINPYQILVIIYRYAVALSAIGLVYFIIGLKVTKRVWGLLGFFGIYTMDIYVSHMNFFRYALGESATAIITGFVIALAASVLLGKLVLRKVPVLNQIFLGGRG